MSDNDQNDAPTTLTMHERQLELQAKFDNVEKNLERLRDGKSGESDNPALSLMKALARGGDRRAEHTGE